ncbi:MAG: serine acetyltransferase, partial [Acidaminococcaceae bacterium]
RWRQKYFATENYVLQQYYLYRARRLMRRNCSIIHFNPKVQRFVTPHGLNGIMVSRGATIGKRCVIFHQVTIGTNTLHDTKGYGAPWIGNNVYIGTGAKIIGNVRIGNNVRIGANCVVVEDVPDNSTVVLEKMRIILKPYPQRNRMRDYDKLPRD